MSETKLIKLDRTHGNTAARYETEIKTGTGQIGTSYRVYKIWISCDCDFPAESKEVLKAVAEMVGDIDHEARQPKGKERSALQKQFDEAYDRMNSFWPRKENGDIDYDAEYSDENRRKFAAAKREVESLHKRLSSTTN